MEKKKVFIGMSGGVDSSVSAALLIEQGFDVTGIFIKVWQPDWMEPASTRGALSTRGGCSWREDRLDAMRVCVHLGIPFLTLDLEKEYKEQVVDYMIEEYRAGKTPNPDIMCNRYVKFGGFFDWAIAHGADYVATGHYSLVRTNERIGKHELVAGKDLGKDQSYFLWTLTQRELAKTLFPVGGLEKSETRRLAKKFDLPVALKRDSQGLCFIGKVDIKEFLSHYIKAQKGDVLDEAGNVIGEHDGALFHTLGERHGFIVAKKTPDDAPYYVVARNIEKNTINVSHKSADGLLDIEKKEYSLASVNWIGAIPESGKIYVARIRHLGELLECNVEQVKNGEAEVGFKSPIIVASGQSVVLYDGDVCIGGGIVM